MAVPQLPAGLGIVRIDGGDGGGRAFAGRIETFDGIAADVNGGAVAQLHIEHAVAVRLAVGAVEAELHPVAARQGHQARTRGGVQRQGHAGGVQAAVQAAMQAFIVGQGDVGVGDVDPWHGLRGAVVHATEDAHAGLDLDRQRAGGLEFGRAVKAAAVALEPQLCHVGQLAAGHAQRRFRDHGLAR